MTWRAIEQARAGLRRQAVRSMHDDPVHGPIAYVLTDDPNYRRTDAAHAALSVVEEALEAAEQVIEEYDDPVEGTPGFSETEFYDRITRLRAALARAREGIT